MEDKQLTTKELTALRHIRNRIMHGEDPPSVRKLADLMGYSSPNAAAHILARLIERGLIRRRADRKLQLLGDLPNDPAHGQTVPVPLVGSVNCGPALLAEQNVEAYIQVARQFAPNSREYFLLRATGASMEDSGIHEGDLLLVRRQATANNGDQVVALLDDSATVKQFHRTAEAVILRPRSSRTGHQPIVLTQDFQIQGVVIRVFHEWEKEEPTMADYDVTKDNKTDEWKATREGADRASGRYPTQAEAERAAKELAGNSGGGEVRIHRPDGQIRDSDTVKPAKDPFPPRDRKH